MDGGRQVQHVRLERGRLQAALHDVLQLVAGIHGVAGAALDGDGLDLIASGELARLSLALRSRRRRLGEEGSNLIVNDIVAHFSFLVGGV